MKSSQIRPKPIAVMAVEAGVVADKVRLELDKQHSVCLVLDFGSQYTQLIGRRVRSLNVYSMLKPGDISLVRAPPQRRHSNAFSYVATSVIKHLL